MFQSRNRGSFDFKANASNAAFVVTVFQSRNRGSFDFKYTIPKACKEVTGFNLVIEVLLISSLYMTLYSMKAESQFQSRNRGSFDFKS